MREHLMLKTMDTHRVCLIPQPLGSEQAREVCWGKPRASAEHGGPLPRWGAEPEPCGGTGPAGFGGALFS